MEKKKQQVSDVGWAKRDTLLHFNGDVNFEHMVEWLGFLVSTEVWGTCSECVDLGWIHSDTVTHRNVHQCVFWWNKYAAHHSLTEAQAGGSLCKLVCIGPQRDLKQPSTLWCTGWFYSKMRVNSLQASDLIIWGISTTCLENKPKAEWWACIQYSY